MFIFSDHVFDKQKNFKQHKIDLYSISAHLSHSSISKKMALIVKYTRINVVYDNKHIDNSMYVDALQPILTLNGYTYS